MWFLLTRGLKWFAIAVALAQIVAPARSPELVGIGRHARLRRTPGPWGFPSAITRAATRKRTGSRWSRAAGGAADLAAIAAALGARGRRTPALGALVALAASKAPRGRRRWDLTAAR